MKDEVRSSYCRYCEGEYDKKFFWSKVPIYKQGTTKAVEGIAIYCAYCHRTIAVIPEHLFFESQNVYDE